MSQQYENALFIFRRDFRVVDNKCLNLTNTIANHIHPVFIFTPEQITGSNKYKSNNAVQFMLESIQDLETQIKKMGGHLICCYGNNETIIKGLIEALNINIVCFNSDYTPYAVERDESIIKMCNKLNVAVQTDHDYYLHPPGSVVNGSGNVYQKFTPFYQNASKRDVDAPTSLRNIKFATGTLRNISHKISLTQAFNRFIKPNENILLRGGRTNALKQIKQSAKNISKYSQTRDDLSKQTSLLSAYIKFGCISIREVYKIFRRNHSFIRQLYWRDFYANVLFAFPHTLTHALKPNYDHIKWHFNSNWFKKWCDGQTGFPIVDAGMRQLNTTGYMHNRARLIVSSFLVKTLLISWQKGAQYFSKNLIDYDPASNQMNWQWVASTGADSQPYFRIFNPMLQAKEHDPDCHYIKTWVPELSELNIKTIHNWDKEWENNRDINYPKPICDYVEQKEKALKMYKDAL